MKIPIDTDDLFPVGSEFHRTPEGTFGIGLAQTDAGRSMDGEKIAGQSSSPYWLHVAREYTEK